MNRWIEKYRAWVRKQDDLSAEAMFRLSSKGVNRTINGIFGIAFFLGTVAGIGIAMMITQGSYWALLIGYGFAVTCVFFFIGGVWEIRRYSKIRISIAKAANTPDGTLDTSGVNTSNPNPGNTRVAVVTVDDDKTETWQKDREKDFEVTPCPLCLHVHPPINRPHIFRGGVVLITNRD